MRSAGGYPVQKPPRRGRGRSPRQGPAPNSSSGRRGKERVPPTPSPDPGGGALQRPRRTEAGPHGSTAPPARQGAPPSARENGPPPPTPTRAARGRRCTVSLPQPPMRPGQATKPAGLAPRRWGLRGGADFTPLPLRPAPVRRVGEAATRPRALQRRGAGRSPRSGARPPPPRSPARQPGPPRSVARAGPEREEAARGEEKAGAEPRHPPAPRSLTTHPSPLQPVPGLGLRTDLTGRDMFAVETGPSRGAKDQDPPHPARSAPHPPQLRPRRPLPPSPELLASQTPPLPGSGPLNQTSPPLPSLFKMDESNQPNFVSSL